MTQLLWTPFFTSSIIQVLQLLPAGNSHGSKLQQGEGLKVFALARTKYLLQDSSLLPSFPPNIFLCLPSSSEASQVAGMGSPSLCYLKAAAWPGAELPCL